MNEYVLLLVGLAIGAFGTLIGVGGGFILVPILLFYYPSWDPNLITSISLAVVFLNAASGSVSYGLMKRIDFKSGLLFLISGIPAAVLGAYLVNFVPRHEFNLIFGAILVAASLFVLFRPNFKPGCFNVSWANVKREMKDSDGNCYEYSFNFPLGMGLAFCVGAVSTLLGIGGGIIHVPAMVCLMDFPVLIATATSQFVLGAMALVGTAVHLTSGTLQPQLPMVAYLGAGAILGAQIGARLSHRINTLWIMRFLAIALGFVGIRILVLALWK